MTTRIAIAGIGGRMGRELMLSAAVRHDVEVVAGLVSPEIVEAVTFDGVEIVDRFEDIPQGIDVIVDFTVPEATVRHANLCRLAGIPFLSGVTGLSSDQMGEVRSAADDIPVFYSRNTSLGIAVLVDLVRQASGSLGKFDIEIVEMHHRRKTDAPSGTAMALLEAAESGRTDAGSRVFGREGEAPRTTREIGVHAIRGGANPGEHTVILAGDGEELRLSHRALSRRTFADGAVNVAAWLPGQGPGFYEMPDYLRG